MAPSSAPGSGYSAWRLIADELRSEIVQRRIAAGAKLPTEDALAERFGVNRHTVRRAVAALAADGLVVARRGSGTYVAEHTVLVHRIGVRTRLSESLGARSGSSATRVIGTAVEQAPPEVAEWLRLGSRDALHTEAMRSVDGIPVSRGTFWIDPERVPRFAADFRRVGSVTAAFREAGIDDYLRASTTVGARPATVAEASDLGLSAGATVLVVRAQDVLPDGTPLLYGITRFAAQRVELEIEHP